MRLRIQFSKFDEMRYTSHLDLHRTWERTFRRAGLPLAYSEGFHPQPKINLASALPLGITSESELVDIWIEYNIEIPAILDQLSSSLPPGIKIISVEEVSQHLPSLQTDLVSTVYQVTIADEIEGLDRRVEAIMNAGTLIRERRGKKYDLRPLIVELSTLRDEQNNYQVIIMKLAARANATGRPDEVLNELSIDPATVQMHRINLLFRDEEAHQAATQAQEES
jgi:radical SAM-linked protein